MFVSLHASTRPSITLSVLSQPFAQFLFGRLVFQLFTQALTQEFLFGASYLFERRRFIGWLRRIISSRSAKPCRQEAMTGFMVRKPRNEASAAPLAYTKAAAMADTRLKGSLLSRHID